MKINGACLAGKILLHIILIIFAVIVILPFYWMILSSLKSEGDFYAKATGLIIKNPVLDNYAALFTKIETVRWFLNSFMVSLLSTSLGVLICSLAGFTFGIYRFKFKQLLFWIVLGSVAIPEIVTIIPVFKLMIDINLINTYAAVVMPYAISMFGIFMMKQYVSSSLPRDMIEAARVDGLTEPGIYIRIALPLLRPPLGVLGIYLWLNSWSGYFWPFIMLKTREMMTLPVGFASLYADPWNLQYGILMAGSFLSTLPIIIIFLFGQEQFIAGLTAGAVKG
jgi:ABC-type glycerol-3-phosphate transport system permease component